MMPHIRSASSNCVIISEIKEKQKTRILKVFWKPLFTIKMPY